MEHSWPPFLGGRKNGFSVVENRWVGEGGRNVAAMVLGHLRSLYNSQNTKWSELGFSAEVGNGASEVRFELTTLS